MSTTDPRYRTARWRRVRAYVLARDGYRCQMRLPGCTTHAPLLGGHVNHRISPRAGGAFLDPDNLEAACRSCNTSDGGRIGNLRKHGPGPSREW